MSLALRRTVRAYARIVLGLVLVSMAMLFALVIVSILSGAPPFGVR